MNLKHIELYELSVLGYLTYKLYVSKSLTWYPIDEFLFIKKDIIVLNYISKFIQIYSK